VTEWIGPIWDSKRWSYLQGADLFCLPSHSENFGIAVLESLRVGTPVLTSDQTPWREHAERDGFFIVHPDIQSISTGLRRAYDRLAKGWTDSDRHSLAAWAEIHFDWNNLAGRYEKAYQAVAGITAQTNSPGVWNDKPGDEGAPHA